MRWKQFFTPVDNINTAEAKKFIDDNPQESFTLLDVRQPKEYKAGHLPGAKLIPLPELKDRFEEIDNKKPLIVYCAVGGRSRVAAQMLSGKNFSTVYNLSGGFKAWQGDIAVGPQDQGLHLFTGSETAVEVLKVAYSLEKGLREFYLLMSPRMTDEKAKQLFAQLAGIEILHQKRIFAEYIRITGKKISFDDFDRDLDANNVEGGLTTEEYLNLYGSDLSSAEDVIGLAMSIEAQALDLYHRAGENTSDQESKKILRQIAVEEQTHLKQLGDLLDRL